MEDMTAAKNDMRKTSLTDFPDHDFSITSPQNEAYIPASVIVKV